MNRAPVIVAAEDNDDDFVLLRCAFESAGFRHKLIGLTNGVDAINYLYADEPYRNRSAFPFPDLLLLDLHMPVMDAFEVLAAVKGRAEFRCLPIVVLSSVDDPVFIQQALNLGATDFLIKPLTMEERLDMVRRLQSRWLPVQKAVVTGTRSLNPLATPLREPKPKKPS